MDAARMSRLAGLDEMIDDNMSDPTRDFIKSRERVDEGHTVTDGDSTADDTDGRDCLVEQEIRVSEARLRRIVSREIRAVIDELRRSGRRLMVTQRPRRRLIH